MDYRVKIKDRHQKRCHSGKINIAIEQHFGSAIGVNISYCVKDTANPKHSHKGVIAEKITNAINKPKKRPFRVGKVHIRNITVHPCFATHKKPCRIFTSP